MIWLAFSLVLMVISVRVVVRLNVNIFVMYQLVILP